MRGWTNLPAWLRLLALAFLTVLVAPSCESGDDRFECGIKVDGNVTQCDEPNQVCICGTVLRCARPDPDCPNRYSFVFGDKACVGAEDVKRIAKADPSTPDNALCPRPQPAAVCGAFDQDRGTILNCASANEACVCNKAGGRCAAAFKSCPSGYAADGECLPLSSEDFVQAIEANAQCGDAPKPAPCGGVDASGRLQMCGEGFVCSCVDGKGSCAREVADTICPSKLLYEAQGAKQCAPEGAKVVARACSEEPIAPVACGARDSEGRVGKCRTGESCACSFEAGAVSGACVKPPDAADPQPCSSGLELVSDRQCLALSETGATVVLAAAETRCPVRAPEEIACGKDPATECDGDTALGCWCNDDPHCLVDEPGCASGVAFAGSRRCASGVDREQIQRTKPCPGSGGEGGVGGEGVGGEGGSSAAAGSGQGGAL